jgi:protein-arginine deiminase
MHLPRGALSRVGWLALGLAGCHRPAPAIDLVVDANRNGQLDPGDPSEEQKDTWDARHGAVLLANLDDDDQDGKPDAADDVVNGDKDIEDLAPISVRPVADLPERASAVLALDAAAAAATRLFRIDGPAGDARSYHAVADATRVALTAADLKHGVDFAIEALDFVTSTAEDAWSGRVQLTLTVNDPRSKAPLVDRAQMRVAPLLLQYDTAPTEAVYYSELGADTRSLVDGMTPALSAGSLQPVGLDLGRMQLDYDQWAQDFFDVGYTSRPGPGGRPIGMKVAIRSAQPDRSAGEVTTRFFLGPDFAAVFKHARDAASDHSYSMNSFGNFSVVPPYDKGDEHYPLGRNLWGAVKGDDTESPDTTYTEFLRAQKVQPPINIDTSWLLVGHVDEFTSFVRTSAPRGWSLLVAAPERARQMLAAVQARGRGDAQLFVGKPDGNGGSAAISIDQVLGSMRLMADNQEAQLRIDAAVSVLRDEIGLAPDEVIPVPFLFERTFGAETAFQPGTVNLLHLDGRVVAPDPFGPIVDGADPFKDDLQRRLAALGVQVYFADDWDTFHLGDGEVHCGTNVSRDLKLPWWESGR